MDTSFLSFPTTVYGWIAIFAAIVSGVLFVRRSDINQIRQNNVDLQRLIDSKDKIISEFREELDKIKRELFELQGVVREKDQRIKALEQVQVTQIIDPKLEAYMNEMSALKDDVKDYMKKTTAYLISIDAKIK